ncbi:efflux RND transporter periplasmic adaptor subunit [Planomicrobium sp. CPCC 101110]|uniref:efflux RND transporter periplasmic adaptor subunit n=1 Tax=Planomicrobium sp. CPCC 101110 TaxID=2599619 RepID=UPI0011B3FAC4|nr:efflux RND transporter periplasmic adaptor subunit [Planomicrobium sp. CPCC 101110]TWT27682.1 efflux RND transporter periplasmic adaptor subunit [Planomicrobium sp. CPCC 101110]
MNRFFFIGLSIAVTAFITANFLLLFGEKSVLPKTVYIGETERTYAAAYTENLPKEAVTAPSRSTQIYVQESEAIDQWLVKEGDAVQGGTELASLNESRTEEQRAIWEAERDALQAELAEVELSLSNLVLERPIGGTDSGTFNDSITDANGNTTDVNVNVDVPQDGPYAAAIAEAERRIAAIGSQLAVVEAQLNQSLANPALISPEEGVVASINRDSEPMSIEIYSNDKVFITYVLEDEWQDVEAQDRAMVHVKGMDQAVSGTVLSVSALPATDSRWLEAYNALDPVDQKNPIAIYEVQLAADSPVEGPIPYGATANAEIVVNEAADAVALPEPWLFDRAEDAGSVLQLQTDGRAATIPVTVSFDVNGKAVLAEGIAPGTIVANEKTLRNFQNAPKVFVPFLSEQPNYELAKSTNWRKYVEYLLARQ